MEEIPDNVINYLISKNLQLLVKEVGEETHKEHYHGMIDMPRKTLYDFFRKNFTGGNKVWSVKECTDIDGWIRYCCKGQQRGVLPDIRYNVGHDVDAVHNAYWDVNDELKQPAVKRKRAVNLLEEIWEDIKEELGTCISGRVIASIVYRWYLKKQKRLPTSFAMHSMCMTYAARVNDMNVGIYQLTDTEMCAKLYPNVEF